MGVGGCLTGSVSPTRPVWLSQPERVEEGALEVDEIKWGEAYQLPLCLRST